MHQDTQIKNGVATLQELLLSNAIASCQIDFVSPNAGARSAITPDEIETMYTHKLILKGLTADDAGVKNLLDVLKNSSFIEDKGSVEVRVGVTFHTANGRILFAFYASALGCVRGKYQAQPIAIRGPLGPWLYDITKRAFLTNHF